MPSDLHMSPPSRNQIFCCHCGSACVVHASMGGRCEACGQSAVHVVDLLVELGFDITVVSSRCACGTISSGARCWRCGAARGGPRQVASPSAAGANDGVDGRPPVFVQCSEGSQGQEFPPATAERPFRFCTRCGREVAPYAAGTASVTEYFEYGDPSAVESGPHYDCEACGALPSHSPHDTGIECGNCGAHIPLYLHFCANCGGPSPFRSKGPGGA